MIPLVAAPPRPRTYLRTFMPTSKPQNGSHAAAAAEDAKTSDKRRQLEVAVRDGHLTTEGKVEVLIDYLGDAFELVGDLHEGFILGRNKMDKDHAAILLRTREIERVLVVNDASNREAHVRMSEALMSLSETIRRNEQAAQKRYEQLMVEVLALKGIRVVTETPEIAAQQRLREIKQLVAVSACFVALWALHVWSLVHK